MRENQEVQKHLGDIGNFGNKPDICYYQTGNSFVRVADNIRVRDIGLKIFNAYSLVKMNRCYLCCRSASYF